MAAEQKVSDIPSTSEHDLTNTISEYLDLHLMFPLLEFVENNEFLKYVPLAPPPPPPAPPAPRTATPSILMVVTLSTTDHGHHHRPHGPSSCAARPPTHPPAHPHPRHRPLRRYDRIEVQKARLALLKPTNMVDYAIEIHQDIAGTEDTPADMATQR